MPSQATKAALPALDRGLHILDQLIRSKRPLRYNELRARLPGIQDSTLSRILKALETYGYADRDPELGYRITSKVQSWSLYLNTSPADLQTLALSELNRLTEIGQESAAIAVFSEDCLRILCSHTVIDGIQVIEPGQLLHYETDHAASIAVLAALPHKQRQKCLKSMHSRFPDQYNFKNILGEMQKDSGILIDRSEARPGICRMAKSFIYNQQIGAIFYCLPSEACRRNEARLTHLLNAAADRLHTVSDA